MASAAPSDLLRSSTKAASEFAGGLGDGAKSLTSGAVNLTSNLGANVTDGAANLAAGAGNLAAGAGNLAAGAGNLAAGAGTAVSGIATGAATELAGAASELTGALAGGVENIVTLGLAKEVEETSAMVREKARLASLRPTPAAYEYKMTAPAWVLMRIKGTFWPLVVRRYEFWIFPLIHIGAVVYAHTWREANDHRSPAQVLWGDEHWMLPWSAIGECTGLMTFFLVFFLGQCYNRFGEFFDICVSIETSVHEVAMSASVHVADAQDRWDIVRYLTAAGIIIYFRVTKLADFKEAMVDASELDRLLTDEKAWLAVDEAIWEKTMGWPRTREQAAAYTQQLGKQLGLSTEQPTRKANTPALLTKTEVEELRKYPGGMMTLVLCTWAMQTAKATKAFAPPILNGLQGSIFKLRAAAYEVRAQLSLPVPLPYFHSLNCLANINYIFYTYALLYWESNLTPIILWVIICVTVGMREVAAALSNPFGEDDVDFPVNKYISQLRGIALAVHASNNPCEFPKAAAAL